MAIQIRGLILHKFLKVAHADGEIVPRADVIVVTEPVQRLVDALHNLYGSHSGKGYGKFEVDEDTYPMQRRVRAYFETGDDNFVAFSLAAMNILKGKADGAALSTGGYVLITHLANENREYLMFAMVTDTIGSAITENLDIEDQKHIDLNNFRVAGRIDLTGWTAGEERYIGMLKGKKAAVSEYFKHFLGCNDTIQPLQETKKLTSSLLGFAQSNIADDAVRDAWLERVFDACDALARAGNEFNIDVFGNEFWPEDPAAIKAVLSNAELQMSDGFIPDRRALRPLVKFKAKTRSWKLEFDRRALRMGDISYDKDAGSLTLRNLPDSLKTELDLEADEE